MFRHMRAFLLTEKAVKHMVQFMNKLARDKRIQIISLLVEGMSLRAITRVTGVSINTVTKLLVDVSEPRVPQPDLPPHTGR